MASLGGSDMSWYQNRDDPWPSCPQPSPSSAVLGWSLGWGLLETPPEVCLQGMALRQLERTEIASIFVGSTSSDLAPH